MIKVGQVEKIITENNPGAPKDVLEEKLEDINEIEKAQEELSSNPLQLREEFEKKKEKWLAFGTNGILIGVKWSYAWKWFEKALKQNTLDTLDSVDYTKEAEEFEKEMTGGLGLGNMYGMGNVHLFAQKLEKKKSKVNE